MPIHNIFIVYVSYFFREEINQHTNLVQINTDDDNVYTFTIKNLWDNNTFEIIDVLIIATIKIQNDHTENIKFSTVIIALK